MKWRKARRSGERAALQPKKRGPKPAKADANEKEIAVLKQQLRRAVARAERAEGLVAIQKKVSEIFGIALPEPNDEENS